MEYKHFSHVHGLVYQQLPQGTEVHCSGCKFPGSGCLYSCWQCSYFLHEQCFQASRSLKHPSHPAHPLTLVPYPTYPSNSFYCNTCNLVGNGFSYCCSECDFDLHVHCAFKPNATPLQETLSPAPNYHSYPNVGYGTQNFSPHPSSPIDQTAGYSFHNANFPSSYPASSETGSYYESIQHNASSNPPLHNSPMPSGYPGSIQHNATPNPPSNTSLMPNTYQESIQHNASFNAPPHNSPMPNLNASPASVPSHQVSGTAPAGNSPVVNSQIKPPEASSSLPQPSEPVRISLLSNPSKVQEVKHFSHQHALQLNDIKDTSPKVCSGCEDNLTGSAYSCVESQCNFHLHKSCFELPREIRHKSHLDHPLTLLAKPASHYTDGQFACNACLQSGAAFVYNCESCSFDLHVECVSLPESIIRPDHKHPLKLFYSNPVPKEEGQQVTFVCDVCQKPVHEIAWIYYCHECDFGTHLECAVYETQPVQKTEEELVREAELKLAMLQLLMNGVRDTANVVNSPNVVYRATDKN
ncbi:uncharacterized protein [Coffea arabica]|uniref:DC1 domain-containing protein n=1 Tax=Coffea arabica TaxID=13443 RepID=A0A6P6WIN0_COFAR|nr:uncharacterized protein LOC113732177 [Coffea arabica]